MTTQRQGNDAVSIHTGAVVNGVQTEAEVLMARHTPNNWPRMADALTKWQGMCENLKAEDKEVKLRSIFMNTTTGGLFNVDKWDRKKPMPNGIMPTKTALGHLVSFIKEADVPSSFVDNLLDDEPQIRSARLLRKLAKTPDRAVIMRTVIADILAGTYVVRAVASEKHSQGNGDDLAIIEQLRKIQHKVPTAVMRVVKQWDNTHVEVVIPNLVKEVKPGVIIQSRINIENSETKGGSYEASVGTLNLRCINGMTSSGANSTVSVKHMGDIRTKMRAAMTTVIDLAEVYLEEYSNAYRVELPRPRAEVIDMAVKRLKLPDPKNIGTKLAALWDIDGEHGAGDTVAGLANAMTRYAQQLPVEKATVLEALAGKVVADGRDAFL